MVLRFLAWRGLQMAITIIGVILVLFLLVRILPGDPARLLAGPEASQEDVEELRRLLGLDRPLHEQFAAYFLSVLSGDLGTSYRTGEPVIDEIMRRLPYTLALAVAAQTLAIAVAVPLGIVAALRPRSIAGYAASIFGVLGSSLPVFWTALLLIWAFSVELKLLPSGGAGTPAHMVLPTAVLALFLMGNLVRITRASLLEVLGANHVVTAHSKGLPWNKVLTRHVIRNALVPIVTLVGVQFGTLLGGAVITETVFGWPGIGRLVVESIFVRDYAVLQGAILIIALFFMLINFFVDMVQMLIDPRTRHV